MTSRLTRSVAAVAFGAALVVAGAGPASADTQKFHEYADTGWNTDYKHPLYQRHDGDDLGFNVTSTSHIDMRWVTCDGDRYGNIVRNVRGDDQPAVKIGKNFDKGDCLYLQYRAHSGQLLFAESVRGVAYYNYNIK